MRAVILTGGFATRLRPLTLTRPKSLLPILDRPLLDWILDIVRNSKIDEVVLSVRYLADLIRQKYGSGDSIGIRIEYAEEIKPLGDAGPIRFVHEIYGLDETFVVIYGDIFTNVDLGAVIEYHKKKGGIATIVLTEVEDPSRYGVAILDEDGRVKKFIEKPPKEKAPSKTINAGIYVFEPEVIKYIPKKYPSKLAKDVIPKIVAQEDTYGYLHRGMWFDIGVPLDYIKANMEALRHYYPQGYVSNDASVDNCELVPPVYISKGVKIGSNSKIGPYTIIGRNCMIGSNVRIRDSLLFSNVIVEDGSMINNAIISERCIIGKWVRIESGSVIGDEVILSDELYIARRTVILPFKEIDSSIMEEGRVIL